MNKYLIIGLYIKKVLSTKNQTVVKENSLMISTCHKMNNKVLSWWT